MSVTAGADRRARARRGAMILAALAAVPSLGASPWDFWSTAKDPFLRGARPYRVTHPKAVGPVGEVERELLSSVFGPLRQRVQRAEAAARQRERLLARDPGAARARLDEAGLIAQLYVAAPKRGAFVSARPKRPRHDAAAVGEIAAAWRSARRGRALPGAAARAMELGWKTREYFLRWGESLDRGWRTTKKKEVEGWRRHLTYCEGQRDRFAAQARSELADTRVAEEIAAVESAKRELFTGLRKSLAADWARVPGWFPEAGFRRLVTEAAALGGDLPAWRDAVAELGETYARLGAEVDDLRGGEDAAAAAAIEAWRGDLDPGPFEARLAAFEARRDRILRSDLGRKLGTLARRVQRAARPAAAKGLSTARHAAAAKRVRAAWDACRKAARPLRAGRVSAEDRARFTADLKAALAREAAEAAAAAARDDRRRRIAGGVPSAADLRLESLDLLRRWARVRAEFAAAATPADRWTAVAARRPADPTLVGLRVAVEALRTARARFERPPEAPGLRLLIELPPAPDEAGRAAGATLRDEFDRLRTEVAAGEAAVASWRRDVGALRDYLVDGYLGREVPALEARVTALERRFDRAANPAASGELVAPLALAERDLGRLREAVAGR